MGMHEDMQKYEIIKTIILDEATRRLVMGKMRLSYHMNNRVSSLLTAIWEETQAIEDEAWEIVAQALGYESMAAARNDDKNLTCNWHTGEVHLREAHEHIAKPRE
jgi:hypothetical protein